MTGVTPLSVAGSVVVGREVNPILRTPDVAAPELWPLVDVGGPVWLSVVGPSVVEESEVEVSVLEVSVLEVSEVEVSEVEVSEVEVSEVEVSVVDVSVVEVPVVEVSVADRVAGVGGSWSVAPATGEPALVGGSATRQMTSPATSKDTNPSTVYAHPRRDGRLPAVAAG